MEDSVTGPNNVTDLTIKTYRHDVGMENYWHVIQPLFLDGLEDANIGKLVLNHNVFG